MKASCLSLMPSFDANARHGVSVGLWVCVQGAWRVEGHGEPLQAPRGRCLRVTRAALPVLTLAARPVRRSQGGITADHNGRIVRPTWRVRFPITVGGKRPAMGHYRHYRYYGCSRGARLPAHPRPSIPPRIGNIGNVGNVPHGPARRADYGCRKAPSVGRKGPIYSLRNCHLASLGGVATGRSWRVSAERARFTICGFAALSGSPARPGLADFSVSGGRSGSQNFFFTVAFRQYDAA